MKRILDILKMFFAAVELILLLVILCNVWVFSVIDGNTYTKISKIPPRKTAVVLGTSPKMKSGVANPYFILRMDAAALLYHHGKVKEILVSGEKSKGYNEPEAMKNYLIYQEGVPENIIIEDFEGFNTRKSISRSKNIFKKNDIIIVSQGFHNLRALFFARNNSMNAIAFEAQDVTKYQSFYRNQSREIFARVEAVFYYFLGISPE